MPKKNNGAQERPMVNCMLRVLAAQKGIREGRQKGFTIDAIAKGAGVGKNFVQSCLANELRRPPLEGIAKLCLWLECEVGDLLKLVEDPPALEDRESPLVETGV